MLVCMLVCMLDFMLFCVHAAYPGAFGPIGAWGVARTVPKTLVAIARAGLKFEPKHIERFVVMAGKQGNGGNHHEQQSPPNQTCQHGSEGHSQKGAKEQCSGYAQKSRFAAKPFEDRVA